MINTTLQGWRFICSFWYPWPYEIMFYGCCLYAIYFIFLPPSIRLPFFSDLALHLETLLLETQIILKLLIQRNFLLYRSLKDWWWKDNQALVVDKGTKMVKVSEYALLCACHLRGTLIKLKHQGWRSCWRTSCERTEVVLWHVSVV